MEFAKEIQKRTGLKVRDIEATVLRGGFYATRFKLEVGNNLLSFTAIEINDLQASDERVLRFIKEYSEFEHVVVVLNYISTIMIAEFQKNRIGYLDKFNNLYIPLDLVVTNLEKKVQRSTSELNEFLIGYLFFQHNGFVRMTQEDIGKWINKSASTVNFLLKKMEQEEEIVKFGLNGYALKNTRLFFDKWRHLLKKFQNKNLRGQYSSLDVTEKIIQNYSSMEKKWKDICFGGPAIDVLKNGYLRNVQSLNIYVSEEYFSEVIERLHLKPDTKGEITIYQSSVGLCENRNGFVHDSLLCAELLNDKNPRIREAGEERVERFLEKLSRENYERYY